MQGFIKSYATQGTSISASHAIMSYFPPERLPGAHPARNRIRRLQRMVFLHSWTDDLQPRVRTLWNVLRQRGYDILLRSDPIVSIYERMIQAGHTAKIYYYDQQSSTMEIVNLLKNQPQIFGSYSEIHRRVQ